MLASKSHQRLLARVSRLRLLRSPSHNGKVLASDDLSEIGHTPKPPSLHRKGSIPLKAKIETLQTEITWLEVTATTHRADFERERADHLMAELLRAAAATLQAKEATAWL